MGLKTYMRVGLLSDKTWDCRPMHIVRIGGKLK